MVHVKIKLDGRMDSRWLMPFTGALTADGFSAVTHVPFEDGSVDTLTVTLHGADFTYDLDSVYFDCHVVLAGTLGR
jgi:hypothetical protein